LGARKAPGVDLPFRLVRSGAERRGITGTSPEPTPIYKHYSGKKKAHADKNILLVNESTGKVLYLSATVAGRTHDKKAADAAGIV
jgi:hypothetical protein